MKKIAIMQPYLLPYIGYFQLISSVDEFVVLDNIEFTKKGWFNRNRILVHGSAFLFTVPLRKDSDYLNVNERFLSEDATRANKKTLQVISNSYRRAPFFDQAYEVAERCLLFKESNLFEYIYNSMKIVATYLELEDKFTLSSSIPASHSTLKAQDKVIAICKARATNTYINAIGGRDLYSRDAFAKEGIDLQFIRSGEIKYNQNGANFVPSLSIIDVLMFNSPDEVNKMLGNYELV